MRIALTFAALTLAAPIAANAQANAQPAPPVAPDRAPVTNATEEKKICHIERMTGSRIRATRICLTRNQWSRLSENTNKDVDTLLDDANQTYAVQHHSSY